jgi:hypothetical protein
LPSKVELVGAAVASVGHEVPIRGCFCFVDTELPMIGTPSICGLSIFGRKGLARQLNGRGPFALEHAAMLAAALAERFPPA